MLHKIHSRKPKAKQISDHFGLAAAGFMGGNNDSLREPLGNGCTDAGVTLVVQFSGLNGPGECGGVVECVSHLSHLRSSWGWLDGLNPPSKNGPIDIRTKFLATNTSQALNVRALLSRDPGETPLLNDRVAGKFQGPGQRGNAAMFGDGPVQGGWVWNCAHADIVDSFSINAS